MHGVFVFLTKLGLYVAAAVGMSEYLHSVGGGVLILRQHSSLIPAVQILVASAMLLVYTACTLILSSIREHQQYDAIDDDQACLVPEPEAVTASAISFVSAKALDRHILKVHATGFLLWKTMVAFDYSQPELVFLFTVGAVGGWLVESMHSRMWSESPVTRLEVTDLLVFVSCYCMIAVMYLCRDGPAANEQIEYTFNRVTSVLAGIAWPVFFAGEQKKILYTIHSSLYTLVLLCVPVVMLHARGMALYDRGSVFVLVVVQPIVKIMCVMIMCLSIRTGHKLDLVVTLTVACFVQFVYMSPLDRTNRIAGIVSMVALVLVHVLAMYMRRRDTTAPSEVLP